MYESFFAYARKRHEIYVLRDSGEPPPWTDDPVLSSCYFTNVYRELDKTTAWFRKNVRDPYKNQPDILLYTVAFRWFNRIDIGRLIFDSMGLRPLGLIEKIVREAYPGGPWVNGAYIIKGYDGMDKLAGVCKCIREFNATSGWRTVARSMERDKWTLEHFTDWLSTFPYQGSFTAYEVACDLRYTRLLGHAEDKCSWANIGPGAKRGLNRILGRDVKTPLNPRHALSYASEILSEAPNNGWHDWEMREVEHTLCEFDKYERVRLGEGRSKRSFDPYTRDTWQASGPVQRTRVQDIPPTA